MAKHFSRLGGKETFFKEVEIFRKGFKLLLERWNWDFLMKGVLEVTSRELKNFQRGLRIFGEIKTFFKCRGRFMLFWVVETFTMNDIFLVDWDFFGGGEADIFL